MAWHFSNAMIAVFENSRSSQAREEEFSAVFCWDGGQSELWKSAPFARDDSCSDKMTGISHLSPFGTMYVPSTDDLGAELLMSYLAGFRAKTSARQVMAQDSPAVEVVCGGNTPESLAKSSLDYVFIENSPLLRTRGLVRVLKDLAAIGYDAEWMVLSAKEVGAWHLRKRMWIVAANTRDQRMGTGEAGATYYRQCEATRTVISNFCRRRKRTARGTARACRESPLWT